jgi:predicted dehydrogenase
MTFNCLALAEAANAGKDVYVEKPFAETMNDANEALIACQKAGIVVQIGSQRRSGANYKAASEYIDSGKFWKYCNGRDVLERESARTLEATE